MEFYSLQFIIFIFFWLLLYYGSQRILNGKRWMVLLAASLSFYVIVEIRGAVFLLATAGSTWLASRTLDWLKKEQKVRYQSCRDRAEKIKIKSCFVKRRRVVLWGCLILNLGMLALLKYTGGIALPGSSLWSHLAVPMGISFYTFQSVSYLADVYNTKYDSELNFGKYLLFVSWFPQLLEGPINRYDAMSSSLFQDHNWSLQRAYEAFLLILFGLFKKYAIAEQLAPLISQIFDNRNAEIPGSVVVFGILLYSAQQYSDFSGGIDIVIGVSKLFGVTMAPNFRQPYFATSLGDFWRRWHISLGAWMRDYVFYPIALLKSMQKLGKWFTKHISGKFGKHLGRTVPACIANLIVFLLVGIWHGAEEHYLAWGLYNGIIIALSDLMSPFWKSAAERIPLRISARMAHLLRILRTFLIVNIGWYFDRIADFEYRRSCFYNTLFSFRLREFRPTLYSFNLDYVMKPVAIAAMGMIVVFVVSVLREKQMDVKGRVMRLSAAAQMFLLIFILLMILSAFVFTAPSGGFLYAQF